MKYADYLDSDDINHIVLNIQFNYTDTTPNTRPHTTPYFS